MLFWRSCYGCFRGYAQQRMDIVSPTIIINLPSRTIELYAGDGLVKEYPIAIGKPSTPTPLGNFSIINKEVDPWWYPPRQGYGVPSGPDNPLGYRWMGFLPMYGIHGTNAPWAIGLAVSNGCIRMHEENAEELFELVTYGTPVRVTYDRIKVRVDGNGQASIGVYPDIYGYHSISLAEAKSKLEIYGLKGLLSDDYLQQLIDEEADHQVVFAGLYSLKVNDKLLTRQIVSQKNVIYLPVWAIAEALKSNVTWDEQNQMVSNGKRAVPGIIKGDIIYVTLDQGKLLFGGQYVWREDNKCLEINGLTVSLNGKMIDNDVQVSNGILALPVMSLAEALGQKIVWDSANQTLRVHGQTVPIEVIANQPYLQITRIYEIFNAYVYWNEQGRSIEITYPFQPIGNAIKN